LSRPRTALVPQLCPWHMPASGKLTTSLFSLSSNKSSFAERLIQAAKGEKGIVEPTFVYLPGVPGGDEIAKETGCDFFSVPVELGVSPPASPYQKSPTFTDRLLCSRPEPRKPSTFLAMSTTMRRNSLRNALRVSRATSQRALNSSQTLHPSNAPLPPCCHQSLTLMV
jgi:hypothetical protein